ncbi:putative Carboxylesterase [Seiridium cardinale]
MVSLKNILIQYVHVAFFTAQAYAAITDWKVGQIVQTTSGPVKGHAAGDADQVSEYLGIPYAQAPIDDQRWQPPASYNGTNIIAAANFGHACMQPPLSLTGTGKRQIPGLHLTEAGFALLKDYATTIPSQDEDCLTLNVWTKPQTGDDKKAVWIHGGGWKTGASGIAWYNGQYFADQEDVVLVSINYRLNIFGFPGNPNTTANLGLLDQRLAIEWIRDNINGFGGDPDRITIFGQSIGGSSVDIYSYAWNDDPIVKGFISQSGVAWVFGPLDQDAATDQWQSSASTVGCTGSTSDTLDCMKGLPATKVLSAIQSSATFGAIIDEKTVFSDYSTRKPVGLPMLIGHTDFEPGLTRALSQITISDDIYDAQEIDNWVCPTAQRAQYAIQNGDPIWRYRYFGAFPNTILSDDPPSGAYHTAELPILFGTVTQTVHTNTDAENDISSYMRGAWAAFAKDPEKGLLSYGGGWPQYSPDQNTLIRLAYSNQTGPNLDGGNAYDSDCSIASSTGTPSSTGTSSPSPTPSNEAGKPPVSRLLYVVSSIAVIIVLVFI